MLPLLRPRGPLRAPSLLGTGAGTSRLAGRKDVATRPFCVPSSGHARDDRLSTPPGGVGRARRGRVVRRLHGHTWRTTVSTTTLDGRPYRVVHPARPVANASLREGYCGPTGPSPRTPCFSPGAGPLSSSRGPICETSSRRAPRSSRPGPTDTAAPSSLSARSASTCAAEAPSPTCTSSSASRTADGRARPAQHSRHLARQVTATTCASSTTCRRPAPARAAPPSSGHARRRLAAAARSAPARPAARSPRTSRRC